MPTDPIDNMLDRQHSYTVARRVSCPYCAQAGKCLDGYGHPTTFVHPSRLEAVGLDPEADPYPLPEPDQDDDRADNWARRSGEG